MSYGNIGDASNNNHKPLHHLIALDPKNVIVYYTLVLLQLYELLWFGIAGIGCAEYQRLFTSFTYFTNLTDLLRHNQINF